MLEMRKASKAEIESSISLCEIVLFSGENDEIKENLFVMCKLESSEKSECVAIKVKGTALIVKVKKSELLHIMGINDVDCSKFYERI